MITNPFYPAFVSGVQVTAEENGYEVITYNTHASHEKETKIIQMIQQGRADGVVGVFFHLHARDLQPLFDQNIAVVRLEVRRHSAGELPLDNMFVDNLMAARDATTYLIRRGHRRIAMLTGFFGPRESRREGYLQALNQSGEDLVPLVVEVSSYNEKGGYEGMLHILRQGGERPSAIFAAATDMEEVVSPSPAICLSRMPVRAVIHSSLVSSVFSRSALVITRGGMYFPQPTILP